MDKNESTCTNTDNMGKLFVMVFADPAPMTNPSKTCIRTRSSERNKNPAP